MPVDALGVGVVGFEDVDVLVVGVALVGFALVGVADGDVDGALVVADGAGVGVGDVVAANAGAVPLTRTSPVPTPMISGFRTDRASTAYNLLNDRLRC